MFADRAANASGALGEHRAWKLKADGAGGAMDDEHGVQPVN
jgi:hypothetical protein